MNQVTNVIESEEFVYNFVNVEELGHELTLCFCHMCAKARFCFW